MAQGKLDKPDPFSREPDPRVCSSAHDKPGNREMASEQERRDSERVSCIRACPYELTKFSGSDQVEFSEGRAFTINMSFGGLLLLLPQTVDERQVFEITLPPVADKKRATKLVEVCWTRPIPVNNRTTMHLAGVRFLFEPPLSEIHPHN
jgi:c-di-GMP-binding flagellar brake protein YcgR